MAALNLKVVDIEEYSRTIGELALLKHDFLSLSADVLVHLAESEVDDNMPRLKAALSFIGTPTADVLSNLRVGWDFLLVVWGSAKLSGIRKRMVCGIMLERIAPMLEREMSLSTALRHMIRKSARKPELREYLLNWARGHFIELETKQPETVQSKPEKRTPKKRRHKKSRRQRGKKNRAR